MAVQIIRSPHEYQGYSTQITDLQAVPDGSTYHSIDTGEEWIFHEGIPYPDLRYARRIKNSNLL